MNLSPADSEARSEPTVPQLVAEVYETVPPGDQRRLLEQLLRPLGVLSLVAVADGVFARLRFRGGWPGLALRLDDLRSVQGAHVQALVDHVEQISTDAVDGLVQLLTSSPVLSGSAAATLLVAMLLRRRSI